MTDPSGDFAAHQDFIVGGLSDNERQMFEERLVRDPALVRELEQSLRMREGLEQLRARGYFKTARPRATRLRVWLPALAAAASAGFVLFLWLSRSVGPSSILMASLGPLGAADNSRPVAAHFTFVSMRGASVPDLDLPAAGYIELRVAPATFSAAGRYRVSLVRQQNGTVENSVAAVADVAVGADGYVHCYADATRLAAGSYVLRMQPDTNIPGTPELFPFTLRPRVIGPAP